MPILFPVSWGCISLNAACPFTLYNVLSVQSKEHNIIRIFTICHLLCILVECNEWNRERKNYEANEEIIARFGILLKCEGKWWIKSEHSKKKEEKIKRFVVAWRYQVPNSKFWINKITDELEDVENIPLNDLRPMKMRTETLKYEER